MVSKLTSLVEAFRSLDLYQAARFSEILLCHLESQVEGQLYCRANDLQLDEKDVKAALTDALRSLVIEMSDHELKKRRNALQDNLQGMYSTHLLAV